MGGRLPRCSWARASTRRSGTYPVEQRGAGPRARDNRETDRPDSGSRQENRDGQDQVLEIGALRQVNSASVPSRLLPTYLLEDPEQVPAEPGRRPLCGLRPRQADSGDQKPQLHITKAGDEALRSLLVCAAQTSWVRMDRTVIYGVGVLRFAERGGEGGEETSGCRCGSQTGRAASQALGNRRNLRPAAQCTESRGETETAL